MAYLIPTSFSRYNLSPEELKTGQSLSLPQEQHIQNLICSAAEEKLSLELDPDNPLRFTQQEASLAGQIAILRHLLDLSEATKTKLEI